MKPNFVFIHADQFRADCIGVERKRSVFTPNIDFLANSGTRFDSAYATTPVCIPQRITALTGKLASNHGVLNNVGIPDFPMDGSLISKLNQNDYCTALVGRGFHTYPVQNNLGFEYYMPGDFTSDDKSYDEFFKYLKNEGNISIDDYYSTGVHNNSYIAAPFQYDMKYHHTNWTTDQAIQFIKERDKDKPFFLSLGYYAPHGPHNPPKEFYDQYYYSDIDDRPAIGSWEIPPIANGNPNASAYVSLDGEALKEVRCRCYQEIRR